MVKLESVSPHYCLIWSNRVSKQEGDCLLDLDGDLAGKVMAELWKERIYCDIAMPESAYGYNSLTNATDKCRLFVAFAIINILKNQWSDTWSASMKHLF